MSSHKHKRRKTSHKHYNEDLNLSEDEINEYWSVHASDSDNEDINEGKRLTSLVRKSYVHHLEQTFVKNYEEWKKTVGIIDTTHNIKKWVTALEQKALRSCMVAELYQKTMIHIISDIKKSTQHSKLYTCTESVRKLQTQLPADKEIQTEIEEIKVKKFSVETQTGKRYTSLLDLPMPKNESSTVPPAVIHGQPIPTIDQIRDCVAKVTPVPRSNISRDQSLSIDVKDTPYNPVINFSPCENNVKVANTLHTVDTNLMSLTTDVCSSIPPIMEEPLTDNIPTMVPPPSLTNTINLSKILESIINKKDIKNSDNAPLESLPLLKANLSEFGDNNTLRDDILLDLQSEFSNPCETVANVGNSNMNDNSDPIFDILSKMECGAVPEEPKQSVNSLISRKQKISTFSVNKHKKSNKLSKQSKDCLDTRLAAMGLLDDDDDDHDTEEIKTDIKQKKSNWHLEFIAQSCNLTKLLSKCNPKQIENLNTKFDKLFGLPREPDMKLSQENVAICRKRIASVVVCELTPLYQAKRIGSKHLFKFLAKHATTTLMQRSYAPEAREIRKHVAELFIGNKDIESEADILF